MRKKLYYIFIILSAIVVASCANRGVGPQGGPKDETPPVLLNEMPANGTTDFRGNIITLQFDEYLQLNDVGNQVLISPPQQRAPLVKALGKKVVVTFEEELRDSTTYMIDFGKAICDNNEKNPIENYCFAFSTGPVIDTLQMSGILINAEDLNPMSGVLVGIHDDLSDTAMLTMPFRHIARTQADGSFLIRNIRPGTYRLYALNDVSKDYLYQPGEGVAFLDTLFVPSVTNTYVPDTVRHLPDSLTTDSLPLSPADSLHLVVDSLLSDSLLLSAPDSLASASDSVASSAHPGMVLKPVYAPSDILLRFFMENKQRRYFQRCTREEAHVFTLLFATRQDSAPAIEWLTHAPILPDTLATDSLPLPLADSLPATDSILADADSLSGGVVDSLTLPMPQTDAPRYLMECNPTFDTIRVWIVDSTFIRMDTLSFLMTYSFTDSLYNLVSKTDTINAIYRAPKLTEKAKAMLAKTKRDPVLDMKSNGSNSFDLYNPIVLKFATPLSSWQTDSLHLYEVVDSIRTPLPLHISKADSAGMTLHVSFEWQPEHSYLLDIDSAAFTDVYGVSSLAQQVRIKVRSLEEYSTLTIKVNPYSPNMMVQILSEKDQPVRTLRATEEGARFEYLKPASYYVRVYEDLNGDSLWTTGDLMRHQQPEPVYYYPQKLTLRANWEFEETLNYLERSILLQKPEEIRKDGNSGKKK